MLIVFILVEPAVPENIGAAARALKTMGFSELRLVNPCSYLTGPARWLAHASNEILEDAKTYSNFKASIDDCDIIIGTSAKNRRVNQDVIQMDDVPELIKRKTLSNEKVAIVFGREESGLKNEELALCDIATTIPLKTTYPSLNLAQAVMLYAYTLSIKDIKKKEKSRDMNEATSQIVKEQSKALLMKVGFESQSPLFNRIIERLMFLGKKDMQLLLSVIKKISSKIQDG